jgi:hypothetical protein
VMRTRKKPSASSSFLIWGSVAMPRMLTPRNLIRPCRIGSLPVLYWRVRPIPDSHAGSS